MNKRQELFIKKVSFLMDKYFLPKKKFSYLVKGLIGAIIFWIYMFLYIFKGVNHYQETLTDANSSEQLQGQLVNFTSSPMFIASVIVFIIFSFIVGYLIMSFVQVAIDLIRKRAFKEFYINESK